ncbi:polysaccharide lyase 6 family protein [Colwellia echini]|uniref:Alginate lyase n=1 Tax=Colwellia echini TaxID=1982103 RepID=A0ABY3MV97_9GAMM|nr:polysaccharide lyase 6 family protein [Colwellia echini]TYK65133.1 alginate lyase [Colwellia echini]
MYSIKTPRYFKTSILSVFVLLASSQVAAKDWLVKTQDAYQAALKKIEAGDKIILADGTWNDFEILFKGKGTKEKPLQLTAQTKGKVILSGQSNLRLAGEHLIVSGLVFKNGYTPSNEVIAFRANKDELANYSRVTEVVIDNYSNPDRFESDYWVGLFGKYNRFDHSHLVGKRNKGVTMAVRLNTEESRENHHRIDHNYFGPRPIFGSNGGETLRIGTSHYSLSDSLTVVENNYFDRCDGEVEIISVKSGSNKLLNNTFFESRGTLTLRHGNGNVVEGNVFKGNGVDHTGGIRIINRDQVVRNNYLADLTGYRFGSGFTIMNGVPNSTINRYHQVVNATVENNSFINVEHIQLGAGSDAERSAAPKDSKFSNNLFFNADNKSPFSVFDDISGISFVDNVSNLLEDNEIKSGINVDIMTLAKASNGLMYPTESNINVGVAKDLKPTTKADTGVSWYEKKEPIVEFNSGKTINVTAGENAIFDAVEKASDGDTLLLAEGTYVENKIVTINKTLSIKSVIPKQAKVTFSRSTLFAIVDHGSLNIDGLTISGSESPDSTGNTLIRTAKWGMTVNYRFTMTNSIIEDLTINHSFHFFDSGSRAFADSITVSGNTFKNITGDIFRLNKEQDDLGIYNAEYLTIENNSFKDVGGSIVNLYRGGKDESTFGPHLSFVNNKVIDSSKDKRNKSSASVFVHGAQVVLITENTFNNSAPIIIEHTVGEPVTVITDNKFVQTDVIDVVELYAPMPHTAELKNNQYSK